MVDIVIDGVEAYLRHIAAFKRSCHCDLSNPNPYLTLEDYILRHGRIWTSQPRPKRYRKRPYRQCFTNTLELVLENPHKLVYCEGYAHKMMTVHHAWAVYATGEKKGMVVDTTWDAPEECEYFGIPFRTDYVMEVASSRELGWAMLDDWEGGWPLLTGKVEPADYHSEHFEFVDRKEVIKELDEAGDALRVTMEKARQYVDSKSS